MSNGQYSYAHDATGTLPANRVTEEAHTVTAVNGRDYNFLIPKFAPYFPESVRLVAVNGSVRTLLVQDVDWVPALMFQGATASIGKPVYGAISFVRSNYAGQVVIERYQTLGGQYTLDDNAMTELIAEIVFNPSGATWEEMTNLPSMYSPTDHPWEFTDMKGQAELVDAVQSIATTILNKTNTSLTAHLQNLLNPHGVNKNQVGLPLVENFAPASTVVGIQGLSNTTVLTPMVLHAILDHFGLTNLANLISIMDEHVQDYNNPHRLDKFQIDLGNVENLPTVTASDIVSRRRVRKFVTMDHLIDYVSMYGCQARDQGTPAYPPKDSLLSIYCNNVNRIGIYATGQGGTYEKIIEINSRDCGYQPPPSSPQHPQQGTLLGKYCSGFDQMGTYADGYGGTFSRLVKVNSEECGYTGPVPPPSGNHPAQGTILSQRCESNTLIKVIANGTGGSYDERVPNSPQCEVQASHPPAGQLVDTSCDGTTLKGRYTNGTGGYYTGVVALNSPDCGYVTPTTPPPTTSPPVTAPPASAQIALTSSKSVVSEGSTFQLTFTMSGFPANTNVAPVLQGTYPNGSARPAVNIPVGVTSSGGSVTLNYTMNHDATRPGAHSFYALIQTASGQVRSNDVPINMLATSVTQNPTLVQTLSKDTIAVGQSVSLTTTVGNLVNGKQYRLNLYKRLPKSNSWSTLGASSIVFTASQSTYSHVTELWNYGDWEVGAMSFQAVTDSDVRSAEVNLNITANKAIKLTFNGQSPTEMTQVSGATVALRADFTDFPITGRSGVASLTVSSLTQDGQVLAAAKDFKFSTNSSGAGTHSANITLTRPAGTTPWSQFRIETKWQSEGKTLTEWSNEIRVVWGQTASNARVTISGVASAVYVNEALNTTVRLEGGEPSTRYRFIPERRFQDWADFAASPGDFSGFTMMTTVAGFAEGTSPWTYTNPAVNTPGNYSIRFRVVKDATPTVNPLLSNVLSTTAFGITRPGLGTPGLPSSSVINAESGNNSSIYFNEWLSVWYSATGLNPNQATEIGLEWKFGNEPASAFREYTNSEFAIPITRNANATGVIAAQQFRLRFSPGDAGLAGSLTLRTFMRVPGGAAKILSQQWITATLVAQNR